MDSVAKRGENSLQHTAKGRTCLNAYVNMR